MDIIYAIASIKYLLTALYNVPSHSNDLSGIPSEREKNRRELICVLALIFERMFNNECVTKGSM